MFHQIVKSGDFGVFSFDHLIIKLRRNGMFTPSRGLYPTKGETIGLTGDQQLNRPM